MKIYCVTNQLPALQFCGPHPKSHGTRGLSNNDHLRFDTKLGHVICEIRHTSCDCVEYTSIPDQTWISGITSKKKARYQPVTYCTY